MTENKTAKKLFDTLIRAQRFICVMHCQGDMHCEVCELVNQALLEAEEELQEDGYTNRDG